MDDIVQHDVKSLNDDTLSNVTIIVVTPKFSIPFVLNANGILIGHTISGDIIKVRVVFEIIKE